MNDEYIIREFRDEDLPALALHWKESVSGWPPGFEITDFSPEGIRIWLLRMKSIATWLGWADGRIVAFLSYEVRSDDREATYVETYNVHPEYQGRGYGRRIMVHCLERAIRDKVKRVDLHTWAANTKAVPLYKKTGFFWRPRKSWVQMYNFLPGVLQNPVVSEFLGDEHWYGCLRQELELKPNDELYNGCSYHRYVFERDGRRLEVLVDPSTSGVTGIKTEGFEIRCDVPGVTHVAGFPERVNWYINSTSDKILPIRIECGGTGGIDYKFEAVIDNPGEHLRETSLTPSPDLRPLEVGWYGIPIECRINAGGREFMLKPGVRAVRPLEVTTFPAPVLMEPGTTREFTINIKSKIGEEIEFEPEFVEAGGVTIEGGIKPGKMEFPKEGGGGIPLVLKAPKEKGLYEIQLTGKLKTKDAGAVIHPIRIGVGVAWKGQAVEVPDDDPDITRVSNGEITVEARSRGGGAKICLYENGQVIFLKDNEEIGEPYSSEFSSAKYKVEVKERANAADISWKVKSRDYEGIGIERVVRMGSGTTVESVIKISNEGGNIFNGSVRSSHRITQGFETYLPLGDRIYSGSTESWFEGNYPVPAEPEAYPEKWRANLVLVSTFGDLIATGVTFSSQCRINMRTWGWSNFEYPVDGLEPGETRVIEGETLIAKTSHWRDVQRIALGGELSKLPLSPSRYVSAESPIFADESRPIFNFRCARAMVPGGKASISLPDGRTEELTGLDWSYREPVRISAPDTGGIPAGIVPVEYKCTVSGREWSGKLPLFIPVKGADIKMEKGREGEYEFLRIDNGCIRYEVSPEFSGSLVRLEEKASAGKNLLQTGFPKAGMWTWFNPWFGGIWPNIWFDFNFHKCGFKGDFVKLNWEGYEWEGVRVTVTPIQEWQSLKYEVFYLTRAGYPVVLNLFRFSETQGNSRELDIEGMVFPNPSGDITKGTVGLLDDGYETVRMPSGKGGPSLTGTTWGAESDPETGKTIGLVANQGVISLWDTGESGKAFWISHKVRTVPQATIEMATMHVVADDASIIPVIADAFKVLGTVTAKSVAEIIQL